MKYKVSGAIAISKASWGCAPALPNQIQVVFLEQAAGKQKVFWSNNFSKMLARCGRAAHICEANEIYKYVFPAAIAFKKLTNS